MVTLFLAGKKGLKSLTSLKEDLLSLIKIVIIGRDPLIESDYAEEIIDFCEANNIEFELSNKIKLFHTESAIAIGWKYLINYNNNQKLIVFHDSLLPRLRGFNPLVTALINGDEEIGVTAIIANEEFDRGDIIEVEKRLISYPIKIKEAIDVISECYANLLNKIISLIKSNTIIVAIEQDENKATYSLWRDEQDYFINWNDSSERILRFINAVGFPYNGARTTLANKTIIIRNAFLVDDLIIENRLAGKVLFKNDSNPVVVCGVGLIALSEVVDLNGEVVDFKNKLRLRFS